MTDLTLTTERLINATPEKVFDAWLNPDMLKRFMIPGGDAMTVPRAEADAREGGRFEIIMKMGDEEMPHRGTYKEISPHKRLVFTWESSASTEPDSTVTLTFTPEGSGTHLSLTHVRFPNETSRANHEMGWGAILSALDGVLIGAEA